MGFDCSTVDLFVETETAGTVGAVVVDAAAGIDVVVVELVKDGAKVDDAELFVFDEAGITLLEVTLDVEFCTEVRVEEDCAELVVVGGLDDKGADVVKLSCLLSLSVCYELIINKRLKLKKKRK